MKFAAALFAAAAVAAPALAAPPRQPTRPPARPHAARPPAHHVQISMQALSEILPLAVEAMRIQQRSYEREERHRRELARRGIAEVPACASERYTVDAGGLSDFSFDEWGEFYIDRRFVTPEEMQTVHAIEAWIRKWFPSDTPRAARPRAVAGYGGMPVFRGFEDARYQKYDALILQTVAAFNADKAAWCGGSPAQAAMIPDLSPALVKSHMIEESGGDGPASLAAWAVDPLQVNVPGDWGAEKRLVGLRKPLRRNEGSPENNIRAAIMYLSRKGFGSSGKPAAARPSATFDGWLAALRRYNGRRDRTHTDRYYSDEYADKIVRRAAQPDLFVPIEIKLKAKAAPAPAPHGAKPAGTDKPSRPAKPAGHAKPAHAANPAPAGARPEAKPSGATLKPTPANPAQKPHATAKPSPRKPAATNPAQKPPAAAKPATRKPAAANQAQKPPSNAKPSSRKPAPAKPAQKPSPNPQSAKPAQKQASPQAAAHQG